MKHYEKGGYDVFHYEFETLHQFLSYIQTAPVNTRVFDSNPRSSHKRSDNGWSGTESFEEAVELCLKGWSQGFEKFVRMKKRIDEKLLEPIVRPRQVADVVGYSPSVPDYLHGNPLNMWNRADVCIPTFINIYLNVSYSARTNHDKIFNRGVIALSLVDALQDRGYSVRFKVFDCATVDDEEMVISFFKLKGDGEKLNIKKTYFPLCHPSFLRRLIFQLDEVTPVTHGYWDSSYGRPADVETIKKIIDTGPNDIIIVQPDEMGVRGYDIDNDLEAILEFTNLQEILAKA